MRIHKFPHSFRIKPLSTAVALAVTASLAAIPSVSAQESSVEEVVVTGSFIRRTDGFVQASPIHQYTAEDLENEGTLNMAEVIDNLTIVNGTSVSQLITQGAFTANTGFNLRGLGTGATLTLVDGRRVPTTNAQRLLPAIMMQRLDIVTDGAAALYGTDAVAGVVNMIPYKSYDGVKFEVLEERDDASSYWSRDISMLAGRSFGDVDMVLGLGHKYNDAMPAYNRPEYAAAGFTHDSSSGRFNVPQRDANGDLTGESATVRDPSCGIGSSPDQSSLGNNPYGIIVPFDPGSCWISYGDMFDFMGETETANAFGNINWEYSNDLTFNGQVLYNRQEALNRFGPSQPMEREHEYPVVRGEMPGNTYRAMDANGAALYAMPLYDSSGAIIRDTYGNAQWQRGPDGTPLLATNRYADIASDPMGGVPFNEDVVIPDSGWLPFNKLGTQTLPAAFDTGSLVTDNDQRLFRIALGADFTVPMLEGWEGKFDYTYSRNQSITKQNQDMSQSAIVDGLNCDILNAPETCFNPFLVVDPRYFNTQEVAESIYTDFESTDENELETFDLIFNGILPIELAGGEVGAAFGYQRRNESLESNPGAGRIANDQGRNGNDQPYALDRSVDSWFAEFAIPVLDNLEISVAVRNEDFTTGQKETISKFGVTWQATDWLNLRATSGEAFIAPSLNDLQAPENCGLIYYEDILSEFGGWIGSCSAGTPGLQPETSDSLSFGFDINLFDDLSWTMSWSETDFQDRIVNGESAEQLAAADAALFYATSGFSPTTSNPYPSSAMLADWMANPLSDKRINRPSSATPSIVRQITGGGQINATSSLVRAIDTTVSYGFALSDVGLPNWGNINMRLQATWLDTYAIQATAASPKVDAVGSTNLTIGQAPGLPEWRANFQLSWNMGPHSIVTNTRYIDAVDYDAQGFDSPFQLAFLGSEWEPTSELRAWTQMDIAYNYRGLEMFGGEFDITVGARNAFDRMPQKTGALYGYVANMQSALGRVFYARASYQF